SSFIDLLKDWGLGGVMGVGGCYLVVGSIAGKIIPIGNYVPLVRLRLRQRVLLAGFGCVLALPIIWSSYGQMINGTRGILFQPPETPERVAAPKTSDQQPRGELPANSVRLARFTGETRAVLASASCPAVESFGLNQRNIRQLKFAPFQGMVFIYVGDVHSASREPTELSVVIGERSSWPSSGHIDESDFYRRLNRVPAENKVAMEISQSGDSTSFTYADRQYRLTVTAVYAVLFGPDKIAVEICEVPEEKRGGSPSV